jgi:muramidase (phage lysozyme)
MLFANAAHAEQVSLLTDTSIFSKRGSLISARVAPLVTAASAPVNMFANRAPSGSFFAPLPNRSAAQVSPQASLNNSLNSGPVSGVERLRSLISRAESRKHSYDAVQHGAKVKPHKIPTQLTLREIYLWIEATPGQPHAIGRYQFIPTTLKRLVTSLGPSLDERFTPELQNALSDILLLEAGYNEVRSGSISRHTFMNNLAKIWAGLPTTSGKSYYDGYAGNHASITWAEFDGEMKKIFPNAKAS